MLTRFFKSRATRGRAGKERKMEEKEERQENLIDQNDNEDPSVDLSHWKREDIVKHLQKNYNISSNQDTRTEQLRCKLRKIIMNSHPIHQALSQLSKEELRSIDTLNSPLSHKLSKEELRSIDTINSPPSHKLSKEEPNSIDNTSSPGA